MSSTLNTELRVVRVIAVQIWQEAYPVSVSISQAIQLFHKFFWWPMLCMHLFCDHYDKILTFDIWYPKGPSMSFYPDFIMILSRFCLDFLKTHFIQILCRFILICEKNLYKIWIKLEKHFFQILSRFFRNSLYPNFILILSG